jgi:large subunit ribosomal protein L29
MKPSEIRALSLEEIDKKILDYREELFNLRFQASMNQITNPMRIRKVRKNIARILTISHEKTKGGKQ